MEAVNILFIISDFYADKRFGRKSALQLGTELFLTQYFKEYIKYRSIAYPDANIDPNTDYKRVGLFVGHELFVNRFSIEAQLGYYIYEPYKNDISVYDRVGLKYYIFQKSIRWIYHKNTFIFSRSFRIWCWCKTLKTIKNEKIYNCI